jgi:hypothetical protein
LARGGSARLDGAGRIVYPKWVPTASSLVARLQTVEGDLPNHLATQIVALGREATELLIPLLHGQPSERSGQQGTTEPCADCGRQHETAESLCCILSALGVRDERILQALVQLLMVHPRAGALYLADYGDPAACPAVLAAIAAFEPHPRESLARIELLDLLEAYASLDGELPADVRTRVDTLLAN